GDDLAGSARHDGVHPQAFASRPSRTSGAGGPGAERMARAELPGDARSRPRERQIVPEGLEVAGPAPLMGGLPSRYEQEWGTEFWGFVNRALAPGAAVLDVGAGRRPTI